MRQITDILRSRVGGNWSILKNLEWDLTYIFRLAFCGVHFQVLFSIRKGKHVTWTVPLATMKNIGSPVLPIVGQHAVTVLVTIAPKKSTKIKSISTKFGVATKSNFNLQSISGISGDSSERLSSFGRVQSPSTGNGLEARHKISPGVHIGFLGIPAGSDPRRSTGHQDHHK